MDISLVATDDLIDELARRNDSLIVGMLRKSAINSSDIDFVWRGGVTSCLGLAENGKLELRDYIKQCKETM